MRFVPWLVPIGAVGAQREQLAAKIQSLVPTSGTPLYTTAVASYNDLKRTFDPARAISPRRTVQHRLADHPEPDLLRHLPSFQRTRPTPCRASYQKAGERRFVVLS